MNRFLPWLLCLALVPASGLLQRAWAAGDSFDVEGKYELVEPPQPTETGNKVEVLDVFWYGCPHCYHFLPILEHYEKTKPDYVEVVHMPAIFNDLWKIHAKVFYTAKLLNVEDALHRPIFDAIHLKGDRLDTKQDIEKFFVEHGVSKQEFENTFDSFAVESGVRRSLVMQDKYGIQGTPTMIVNGKYRVTGSLAGSYENMIKVVAALAKKEHEAMTAQKN